MSAIDGRTTVDVIVHDTVQEAGEAAGHSAADALVRTLDHAPRARVIFASAPSQEQMLGTLGEDTRIDWSRVRSFHMDEYLGLDPTHPAAFGKWLAERLPRAAIPGFERIHADTNPDQEVRRYSALLAEAPIDLVCLGIGVNGHIAFNEPGGTDFEDPTLVRRIELTRASRMQQVDEGLFATLDEVPDLALTLTVPAMLSGRTMVCTVLGPSKARAVADSLTGPVTADVPASALHTHPNATVHLDRGAASELPERLRVHGGQDMDS